MITVASALSVDTAPDVVFDYLSNPHNQVHWTPNFTELEEPPAPPIGLGSTYRGKLKAFGSALFTIDEYEPKTHFRVALDPRGGHLTHSFTVVGIDTGTRVDHEVGFEPKGVAKVMTPLMRKMIKKMVAKLDQQMHAKLTELSKPRKA